MGNVGEGSGDEEVGGWFGGHDCGFRGREGRRELEVSLGKNGWTIWK